MDFPVIKKYGFIDLVVTRPGDGFLSDSTDQLVDGSFYDSLQLIFLRATNILNLKMSMEWEIWLQTCSIKILRRKEIPKYQSTRTTLIM